MEVLSSSVTLRYPWARLSTATVGVGKQTDQQVR